MVSAKSGIYRRRGLSITTSVSVCIATVCLCVGHAVASERSLMTVVFEYESSSGLITHKLVVELYISFRPFPRLPSPPFPSLPPLRSRPLKSS